MDIGVACCNTFLKYEADIKMSSFLESKNHFLLFLDKRNQPVVIYSNHYRDREIFFG